MRCYEYTFVFRNWVRIKGDGLVEFHCMKGKEEFEFLGSFDVAAE